MDESLLTRIAELHTQLGPQWKKIGEQLNEDPEKIRSLWRRNSEWGEHLAELEQELIILDKKKSEKINWRELANHAQSGALLSSRMDSSQETSSIQINTDKPIAVVFTGDWHLGDSTTNYSQWLSDIKSIIVTNNMYMIDLGDDYQNMRSFKNLASVLSQVLSPAQQAALMRSLIDELSDNHKLIAKVGGNHDLEFDERLFGQALQGYLYEKAEAPIFNNRGLLKLTVGNQLYTILVFHKSRFKSFIRPAHGAFREWQMSYPAEIVAGGHDHVPGVEIFNGYGWAEELDDGFGGEVFLIKTGSYQRSEFGFRYFGTPKIFNPTVILYPDRHRKVIVTCIEDALPFIQ